MLDILAPFGDPHALRITVPRMKGNSLDFSFSGVKTSMLRWVQTHISPEELTNRRDAQKAKDSLSIAEWLSVTPQATLDAIASFQHMVVDELLNHTTQAVRDTDALGVVIAGGVACNSGLRSGATSSRLGRPAWFTTPKLSSDNAAMIGAAAWPKYERGEFTDLGIRAYANLPLA
jgi:N6-L-threonylcarbamoyladenine synthase